MGSGGGGGGGTTNTVAAPWSKQEPYLGGGWVTTQQQNEDGTYTSQKDWNPGVFSEAYSLYQNGGLAPDYYSGNTVASQSPYTTQAYNVVSGQANKGDNQYGSMLKAYAATNNAMQNAVTGNEGLQALESMTDAVNPYSQKLLSQAIDQQTGQLNGNFSQAGRYGSGAHEAAVADAATNLTNQFYSDAYDKQMQAAQSAASAYNNALNTQTQASQAAQNLYNQRYTDAQWLSDIGANQENYNQAKIDADIDRYNYNAQQPLTALSNLNQLIQGTYGGTTTSTGKSGYSGSALGSAIGGASAAAGLYSALAGDDGLLSYFQ